MKKLYCMYLGASLVVFANISFLNWRFYVIIIPVIILEIFGN